MSESEVCKSVVLGQAQRRAIAVLIPTLAERLKLDEVNGRAISFTVSELKSIGKEIAKALVDAPTGMVRNSMYHVKDIVSKAIKDVDRIGSIPKTERIYQFKITLIDSSPPIWRRIQVRRCFLAKLHEYIQTAFGWQNCHLHQFEADGLTYGDPEQLLEGFLDDPEIVDSASTHIDDIIPSSGKRSRFKYLYDFGDHWEHEVLFEGCLQAEKGQRYPLCIEGARACPPEDVGGVPGYEDYLEALADRHHEQHEAMMDCVVRSIPSCFIQRRPLGACVEVGLNGTA